MKKIVILFLGMLILYSCKEKDKDPRRIVELSTGYGNIKIRLYEETPVHRDNFIRLVQDSVFDGMLFHRVIDQFMIQSGDPDSKNAAPGVRLGESTVGENLAAEFRPQLYHKKGVIAAAREGDSVNPERSSSASQFYLVQGKVYTEEELDERVNAINESRKTAIYKSLIESNREEFDSLQAALNVGGMDLLTEKLTALCEKQFETEKLVLTDEQRIAYTTVGGTPHLDGMYTIFGEVIEGLEVIDKIAAVKTDRYDRPLEDVRIKIKLIK